MTRPLALGMALVAVLLLVACANAGGLLVARFAARQTEFGIRVAIGAGRARLARQLFVEALLLAMLAACRRAAHRPRRGTDARQRDPVWLRSRRVRRALRLAAGLLHGGDVNRGGADCRRAFAAARAAERSLGGAERRTRGRSSADRRATDVLIAAQIGCSLLLLVAAAAMGRTLINLESRQSRLRPIGRDRLHRRCECGADHPLAGVAGLFRRLYDGLAGHARSRTGSRWRTSACSRRA